MGKVGSNIIVTSDHDIPLDVASVHTVRRNPRGGPRQPTHRYLDHVRADIVYGNGASTHDKFLYGLLIVDQATRMNWVFGLRSITAASLISVFSKVLNRGWWYSSVLRLRL